jgi:acetyl esterase/lipase
MMISAGVMSTIMAAVVKPIYGPPVPIRWQRRLGDLLGALQPHPSGVMTSDLTLGRRPGRRYAPQGAREDCAVLWIHGGAFVSGSYRTHGSFAAHLAAATGLPVYLLDYRLAPESHYRQALEDIADAAAALQPTRLVLGGDSAGGCLALLAAPHLELEGLALISPMVDLSLQLARAWTGKDALVRTSWIEDGVARMFPLGPPAVPDPEVPTVIHVADRERLRQEGERLADRVGAEILVVAGGWHDLHLQAGQVKRSGEAVKELAASISQFVTA